ncbi:MAG: response regulator, partial [Bacteriovoracaceae bacterium]|nr:response regulator [Bacteriovoracaceae bacterium]
MYRILVVDDDEILQATLQQTLTLHNFYVRGAYNGETAVKMVLAEKFDLVVMDVNMPGMNGLEAMAEIKRFDPTIIVIILTAYSTVADAVKAVKAGAYNYLEKPMMADDLVALIRRALKAQSLVETSVFSAPRLLGPEADKF